MQASSLQASQLLSTYLGRKNEKIGQSIVKSDFAGELKKLMPAPSNDASAVSRTASEDAEESASASSASSETKTKKTKKPSRNAGESEKTSEGTNATDAKTKLKNIKTRAKNSETLYIANPAMIETILSDLQYPAETIQAYKSLQNKEGMISVKDLKSLLERQPGPVGDAEQGRISSEKAQALLGAIVAREGGQVTHTLGNGKLAASLGVTANSSYSASEFRDLVDRVLQTNNKQADSGKNGQTEAGIASQIASNVQKGQTKSLASSALPSFLKEKGETTVTPGSEAAKTRTATANAETASSVPAAERKPGAARPDVTEEIAGASSSSASLTESSAANIAAGYDKTVKNPADRYAVAPQGAAAPIEEQAAPAMKIEDLAAALDQLNGKIVSVESATAAAKGENPLQSPTLEDIVSQVQNLSVAAKDAEKQATRIPASELGDPRDIGEILHPNQITTDPADGGEGHSKDSGSESPFSMIADGMKKSVEEKRASENPSNNFASVELGESEVLREAREKGATAPAVISQASEDAASGVKKEAAENNDQLAQSGTVHSAKSASGEAAEAEAPVKGESGSRVTMPDAGKAAQVLGKGATESANLAGANAASARSFDAEAGWSESGEVRGTEQTGAGVSASAAKLETTGLTGGKTHARLYEDIAASNEVKAGGGNRDGAPEWTMVQNRAEDFQGARINVGSMQNTSGNGFSFYDPYHAVDLAQSAREAAESVENGLVLDLEPDELGKMSIKVGAKDSDVSAMVMTESESARQALVKGAPELRQNLQDQGLSLGKFMVDVNREKTGGGNDQGAGNSGSSNFSFPQSDKASQKTVRTQTVYRSASSNSQINLFA
ncbi:MAG: flagellar hook-length control protein FliK [Desulfobacteraceae bacterium]|nr:flagellar hook-length control protein FliK [Desulfobacteraceae bacterium]